MRTPENKSSRARRHPLPETARKQSIENEQRKVGRSIICIFVGEYIVEVFFPRRILPNGKVLRPTREMMRVTPTGVLEWFH